MILPWKKKTGVRETETKLEMDGFWYFASFLGEVRWVGGDAFLFNHKTTKHNHVSFLKVTGDSFNWKGNLVVVRCSCQS